MQKIILVCTRHEEYGNCNSIELYKIIEKIKPEIIFEELSYLHFDEIYKQKSLITLESNAVTSYLEKYIVEHIPVDTYPLPHSYYEDLDRMYNKIINSNAINESYSLRNLIENQKTLISQYGFNYLNSNQNDQHYEQFNFIKEKILNILNDENLFRIYRMEKEMIEKREYEIISNIYNYSRDNSYNQSILFIGSGHRKSIIKLIEKFEMYENIKLNWIFYNC